MRQAPDRSPARAYALLLLFAAAAAAALWWATPAGIGVSNDTVQYIDCAENLAEGKGYTTSLHNYYHPAPLSEYILRWRTTGAVDLPLRPEIQFPPLYPALLAALGRLGWKSYAAARGLGIIFFAFNIFWTGFLVFRFTRRSFPAAWAGAILMAAAEGMLDVHSAGYSEPLFIALSLVGLTILSKHFETGRVRPLLFGAAVIGLSYGAKYTGGMLIVSCVIGLLLFGRGRPARRARDAAVFLTAAGFLPGVLMLRNLLVGGDAANRIFGFRAVSGPFLAGVWRTLTSWAAPGAARIPFTVAAGVLPACIAAAIAAVLAAAAIGEVRNRRSGSLLASPGTKPSGPPILFLLYPPVYVLLFFAAASWLDEKLIPDVRLFAPIFPIAVIGSIHLLNRAVGRLGPGWRRSGALILTAAYIGGYALAGLVGLRTIRSGRGYAGEFWRRADIASAVEEVRAHPGFLIFTNDDTALRYFTGRSAYFTPFALFLRPDPAVRADLEGVPALFVYWKSAAHARAERKYSDGEQAEIQRAAARALNLRLVLDGPDAAVLETGSRR